MSDIIAGDPAPTNPTAREQLFRRVAGAFVDEAKANALLDAYRAEVLTEAAEFFEGVLKETLHPEKDARYWSAVHDMTHGLRCRAAGGAR